MRPLYRLSMLLTAFASLLAGCEDAVGPDVNAPTVVITNPAESEVVTEGTVTLSGMVSDDRRVVGAGYIINDGTEQSLTITPGLEATWTITLEASVGISTVAVVARDAAGNIGRAELRVIRKDVTPPAVRITNPAQSEVVTEGTVTLSGVVSDDQGVVGAGYIINDGPEQSLTITPGLEAAWTITLEASVGSSTVAVIARDAAGNTGRAELRVLRKDVTLPTIRLTSPQGDTTVTSSTSTFTFRGTIFDDLAVTEA